MRTLPGSCPRRRMTINKIKEDESCSRVDIKYSVTEYVDGEYYQSNFSYEDITEEQFAAMVQALMDWHRTGKLVIDGLTVALAYCGENTSIHASKELPAVNTAELIENHLPVNLCLRLRPGCGITLPYSLRR